MLYSCYGDIMDNNMYTNIFNNDDETGADNRGKFSDRLKKIRRDRLKLKKRRIPLEEKKENVLKTGVRNVFKIFLALPAVAYSVVKDEGKKEAVNNNSTGNYNYDVGNKLNALNNLTNLGDSKKIKVNKIREMNISSLRKKKEIELKKYEKMAINADREQLTNEKKEVLNNIENDERIVKLQKEIIDLIKKQLVKNINELEILQSELYLLKIVNGDESYLKDCQEKIKEIKKLLSRLNSLKDKYDYLKDNYDFEYMYEHGDEVLVDKILELKELCNKDDVKYVVDNYKLLDEYKFLYLKIDKLQEDTYKYEEYKKQKELELKERDINFEKLKKETYNIDIENQRYDIFVKEQEFFLKQLDNKINNIDMKERITYNLKGFNQLVANSFKFIGLMLLNPFKGFIPSIAVQTAMTKNVIHNLYNNLEFQSKREVIYEAIDYSTSINIAQSSLGDTLSLVNSTLDDIARLKLRYKHEFSRNHGVVSGYKETIKKLNKMENAIIGNKVKIELMQMRLKTQEKENKNKLERVKKLNTSNNN